MTEDYATCYRILGIAPGASWKQLRQAYKKQVNAWHPDRFQQNPRKKKQAEEKTKEITRCYKELADYYRRHGALPLSGDDQVPAGEAPRQTEEPEAAATAEPVSATPPEPVPHDFSKRAFRGIAVVALLGFAYLMWQVAPDEHRHRPERNDHAGNRPEEPRAATTAPDTAKPEGYFTVGSSLGEVYAIQGVPTRTEGDIWHYGDSKVYFADGKVLHWDESIDNPLRVHGLAEAYGRPRLYFGIGSSREDVLAVQGRPDRDTGNVWEYGFSRVYFKNDRVTGWHEEPMMALRVRR